MKIDGGHFVVTGGAGPRRLVVGRNMLGRVLMQVRADMRRQRPQHNPKPRIVVQTPQKKCIIAKGPVTARAMAMAAPGIRVVRSKQAPTRYRPCRSAEPPRLVDIHQKNNVALILNKR